MKTSIILRDGREFNISYLKAPNIISLLKDEVSQYTSAPFNVRVESESAVFYKIPRVTFWEYVNKDKNFKIILMPTTEKNFHKQSIVSSL